jgi:hypothetical protein
VNYPRNACYRWRSKRGLSMFGLHDPSAFRRARCASSLTIFALALSMVAIVPGAAYAQQPNRNVECLSRLPQNLLEDRSASVATLATWSRMDRQIYNERRQRFGGAAIVYGVPVEADYEDETVAMESLRSISSLRSSLARSDSVFRSYFNRESVDIYRLCVNARGEKPLRVAVTRDAPRAQTAIIGINWSPNVETRDVIFTVSISGATWTNGGGSAPRTIPTPAAAQEFLEPVSRAGNSDIVVTVRAAPRGTSVHQDVATLPFEPEITLQPIVRDVVYRDQVTVERSVSHYHNMAIVPTPGFFILTRSVSANSEYRDGQRMNPAAFSGAAGGVSSLRVTPAGIDGRAFFGGSPEGRAVYDVIVKFREVQYVATVNTEIHRLPVAAAVMPPDQRRRQ